MSNDNNIIRTGPQKPLVESDPGYGITKMKTAARAVFVGKNANIVLAGMGIHGHLSHYLRTGELMEKYGSPEELLARAERFMNKSFGGSLKLARDAIDTWVRLMAPTIEIHDLNGRVTRLMDDEPTELAAAAAALAKFTGGR